MSGHRIREGEGTDEVDAIFRCGEDELRIESVIVMVLFQHEAIGRQQLQNAIHRRAKRAVGLQRCDQRLALAQTNGEAIDIASLAEPAIDHDWHRGQHLWFCRRVIRFLLVDLRHRADEEGSQLAGPLLVMQTNPANAGSHLRRDGDGELALLLCGLDFDPLAIGPRAHRPGWQGAAGADLDRLALLGAGGEQGG